MRLYSSLSDQESSPRPTIRKNIHFKEQQQQQQRNINLNNNNNNNDYDDVSSVGHRYDISDAITVVRDREHAKRVIAILRSHDLNTPDGTPRVWACDTEVADIDLKCVGPVGNGIVTCVSIFGGPDVDFGDGAGGALWIDNLGDAAGVLQEFKEWFEDANVKKVWHNYGFDRHVMNNEGIDVKGFEGDTMHMARLWDTSRDRTSGGGGEGYSLATLSQELIDDERFAKVKMIDLFGVPKLRKDGTPSKVKVLPPIDELQQMSEFRDNFIQYSARDAIATWWVRYEIETRLKLMPWVIEGRKMGTMMEFYDMYLKDFGELLTDMEAAGVKVDTDGHLKNAEMLAREERIRLEKHFIDWATSYCPDAVDMNLASTAQMQQFFFGQYENKIPKNMERTFKVEKTKEELAFEEAEVTSINPYAGQTAPQLKDQLRERGLKLSGKKSELVARLMDDDAIKDADIGSYEGKKYTDMTTDDLMDICIARGLEWQNGSGIDERESMLEALKIDAEFIASMDAEHLQRVSQAVELDKVKKHREITIKSLGMTPSEFTPAGTPQVSAAILRKLAGTDVLGPEEDAVWGLAYDFFGGGKKGMEACRAIGALAQIGQIDATITNFLVPLQTLADIDRRIHCSLNLNTETGRLSSRRPNLQNQPALEKDSYRIRDAFVAEEGKTLIVADYGQLELRLLAHITGCTSMVDAFASGGCFHSRTAVGMYKHIKEAVDTGDVLLEWDYSKGQPDVPLVKDTYASERRKAKTLNFSIAYGKTVHGLANDWGITTEEAEETLGAWYSDRPEVKSWQEQTRSLCKREGYVRTLMGRYRRLPNAMAKTRATKGEVGHALRAAINTPIQGSAADVVMMAMIKLWKSQKLKDLGWKLLLQVHDEVMLEGPKESVKEAMSEVIDCMENPWDNYGLNPLTIHLDVDAKHADTWYKAK